MKPSRLTRRCFLTTTTAALAGHGFSSTGADDQEPELRAGARQWPQFKGSACRSGDNPRAALQLPLSRITAIQFPAPIYASPAVMDRLVYIQDARGHLACIDSDKNQVVWLQALGGINNSSSPAVVNGKVFVGSTTGALVILDARTGRDIKRVSLAGPVVAAPAITAGALYVSTLNGKLSKLDLNGTILWTFDGGQTSITELAVRGDRIAFFAGTDNTIQYLLRDAGEKVEVLQKRPSSEQTCPTSGPVFVSDTDYAYQCFDSEFGSFFVNDRILAIDTGETRGVPSVRGRLLFRGDKCWDLDRVDFTKLKKHPQQGGTTAAPLWRTNRQSLYDGGFHSSPALAKEHIVIGSELGKLLVFSLAGNDRERKPAWEFATSRAGQANGAISSSPAVVDGRVFFGGEDGILYGLGQGAEVPVKSIAVSADTRSAVPLLAGNNWPTPGGDVGLSYVATGTTIKPPFKVKWRTRVWSTFKGPLIVAEAKVFGSGRGGLLVALSASTGEILWKTHHPGVESRPAPTYADGKLFLLRSQGGQGDSPHVIGASGGPPGEGVWCHDAASGKTVWHRPMPIAYHFNADALSVAHGKVIVCTPEGDGRLQVVALSARDGKEIWHTPLEGLTPGRQRLVRFSTVIIEKICCVSVQSWVKEQAGATLALDIDTGKTLWRNNERAIQNRSRLAARQGVLVLFDANGTHAFDPKTGHLLWNGPGKGSIQPLTDFFLESKGDRGQMPIGGGCAYPIFANGLWYMHDTRAQYSSNHVVVRNADAKIVWEHPFLSNACPSPVPAYDRLYYSPNAEGIIYCFESTG